MLRKRHDFSVFGYVLIPEHVHLLLSEPPDISLANVLRALKGETSKHLKGDRKQFWQRRYHDVNVVPWDKGVEKIKYMHRNPVERGFVSAPAEYPWSSFRHYAFNEPAPVQWTLDGSKAGSAAEPTHADDAAVVMNGAPETESPTYTIQRATRRRY